MLRSKSHQRYQNRSSNLAAAGTRYKKDDVAYRCFTCNPEVTYVLEYTPSKMPDADIIIMAESVETIEEE